MAGACRLAGLCEGLKSGKTVLDSLGVSCRLGFPGGEEGHEGTQEVVLRDLVLKPKT